MTKKFIVGLLSISILLTATSEVAMADQGFVVAPGRADIAFDTASNVLYISGTDELRRYDVKSQTFLDPIHLGGHTMGMDISPDGKTLAVANTTYGSSTNFIDLVNLKTGTSSRVDFGLSFYEGGTYSVAFDSQGKLLVTSQFLGSGWTPLRKYDPVMSTTQVLGTVTQDVMLSASANRKVIGVAEANISDGRWGYYQTGDTSYSSQHQWYDPITGGTGWFNFEIAVSPNGTQFAIPTYGGTFIGTKDSVTPKIGTYAGISPIGAAYSPTSGDLFLPFAETNYLAEYDSVSLEEIARFTMPTGFEWPGNNAFGNGRTKVSADGDYVFTTVGDGIFYAGLATVPEPATLLECLLALAALRFVRRRGAN
jgi:hypothetical protein